MPTLKRATAALCDIAGEGPNDTYQHYTARVKLEPPYLIIGDADPIWETLTVQDLEGDPFY